MRLAARRGLFNGLILSAWTLAFLSVPHISTWVYYTLGPEVHFR